MPQRFLQADSGSSIALGLGEEFDVVLDENPTTGYLWHAAISPVGILVLEQDQFVAMGTGVGGGGERHIRFRAAQPGQFALTCHNYRDWESQAAAVGTFELNGVVR